MGATAKQPISSITVMTVTPALVCVSSVPACGGMTTVKWVPFFSVPVLVPPTDPEICRLCTWCEDTSERNLE